MTHLANDRANAIHSIERIVNRYDDSGCQKMIRWNLSSLSKKLCQNECACPSCLRSEARIHVFDVFVNVNERKNVPSKSVSMIQAIRGKFSVCVESTGVNEVRGTRSALASTHSLLLRTMTVQLSAIGQLGGAEVSPMSSQHR